MSVENIEYSFSYMKLTDPTLFKLQIRLNKDHLNASTQLKVAFDNIKASTKNLLSKFVKRQFKSRLISPSSKYTTIYVSNLVTNALSIYNSKAVIINLCYKFYTNSSIKYIETLKKSSDVLENIKPFSPFSTMDSCDICTPFTVLRDKLIKKKFP